MAIQIVLIDDDVLITDPLERALQKAGYEVVVAHNGQDGLDAARQPGTQLVVLDIMLPDMDGWEVCKQLRQDSHVPILMLTALGDEIDRILGLELGADDYLTKPFSTRELTARIKALLRRVEMDRTATPATPILSAGPVEMNTESRIVRINGTTLDLRYKEFELLSLLAMRAGEVVTRAEIFDEVWGTDWLGDTRTLDVHIRWLREKIEENPGDPQLIQTVRGMGYRFVATGQHS